MRWGTKGRDLPTRYLKPGIRDSERIDRVSNPDAEILYYRLIASVDDFGRHDARADMIKAACFPIRKRATADKCMQWLQHLEKACLLMTYEVDGKPYLQLTKWDNKPRAEKSKFPDPPTDAYNRMQMLPVTETVTVTETQTDAAKAAVRVNGKEKKTSIPEGFGGSFSPSMQKWLETRGETQVRAHLIHFVGYVKANGKKYADWEQAFQNAVREDWAGVRKAGL